MLPSTAAVLTSYNEQATTVSQAPVFTAAYMGSYAVTPQDDVAALWDELLTPDVAGFVVFR